MPIPTKLTIAQTMTDPSHLPLVEIAGVIHQTEAEAEAAEMTMIAMKITMNYSTPSKQIEGTKASWVLRY